MVTSETHRYVVGFERSRDPVDVEAVVEHGGGPVDHRAHHDAEPGDVAERQAAEPAVGRLDADVEAGADGAPEEVAVGQLDRLRRAGAATGQHPAAGGVHVVLAEQRQVGLGLGQLAGITEVDGRLLGGDDRGALGRGQPRAQRQKHGADLHQRVDEHHLLAARLHRQRGDRAATHAVGLQPPRNPGRLGLELGVGHLGPVRDQRGAVGAALRSLGEPVVEFHRYGDIVPIMPQRHKEAPPEEDLYAPIEWRAAAEYGDIRYEKADGIAKITIDRPEMLNAFRPQTLVEVSAAMELAREDTEVGVVVLTGEGRRRSAPAATRVCAATAATSPRAPRSAASTSPTCRCRCGGCRPAAAGSSGRRPAPVPNRPVSVFAWPRLSSPGTLDALKWF